MKTRRIPTLIIVWIIGFFLGWGLREPKEILITTHEKIPALDLSRPKEEVINLAKAILNFYGEYQDEAWYEGYSEGYKQAKRKELGVW